MEHSTDIAAFDKLINENSMVMVLFGGHTCSVCHSLSPKLKSLLVSFFPDILFLEFMVEDNPELAARFSVFTIPVLLFFIEGKEYIREVRNIDLSLLYNKLEKLVSLYNQ